jgi:hypothetical protein
MPEKFIPTDDQKNRDIVKLRRGRILRASKQTLPYDKPLDTDAGDLPNFLSGAQPEHYDRNDLPSRVERWREAFSMGARGICLPVRVQLLSAKAALKSLISALHGWLSAGVEVEDQPRLSIRPTQSPDVTLRPWHPRLLLLHRKVHADWQRGLPFAIQAQFAVGVFAFVLLAALILTSLSTPTFRPHGLRHSNVASPPLFDIEARLDFGPGLRSWFMAGRAMVNKPNLATQGAQSSPTGPGDQAPNWISVPGLAILSGLPRGARVLNGVLVNEAQWGVPTGGDDLTVIAVPSSAEQSFRTSFTLFDGAGSPSGRINLMVTHDAPATPTVDLMNQQQLQRSETKVVATNSRRHQKHQLKRSQTIFKKPPPSPLITGSAAPLLEPAPLPPILSFLGVLAPQPVNPQVPSPITGSTGSSPASAPTLPSTVPPDTPIATSNSGIPATLSDVFKNSY